MHEIAGLKPPIYALSPMDGITDTSMRQIVKKYGNPDLLFTEFVNVMGLCIAGDKILDMLYYEEVERPIFAQLFGKEPEYFYHAAKVICALGFDGVDINMGCPAKNVASRGAGASLIQTPELALEIIRQTKKGVEDWVKDGELMGLRAKVLRAVELQVKSYELRVKDLTPNPSPSKMERVVEDRVRLKTQKAKLKTEPADSLDLKRLETRDWELETATYKLKPKTLSNDQRLTSNDSSTHYQLRTTHSSLGQQNLLKEKRYAIPVSVKTRIGYDKPVTKWWVQKLSEANPDWISIHGRTLKQMYGGKADWDELKTAVGSTDIPVLVNGDVKSYEDIEKILMHTGAAGVLIGRGALGNPFVFRDWRLETGDWDNPSYVLLRLTSSSPLTKGEVSRSDGGVADQPFTSFRASSLITRTQRSSQSLITNHPALPAGSQLLSIMLEHATLFTKYNPDPKDFVKMRKHFGWYCSQIQKCYNALGTPTAPILGFKSVKELKIKLMSVESQEEVERILL